VGDAQTHTQCYVVNITQPTQVCQPNENSRCEGTTLITRKTTGNQPNCNEQIINRQDNHPSCGPTYQCPQINKDKGQSCDDGN